MAVEACRIREGIRTFLAQCRMAGLSHASAYVYYIQGKSAGGSKIPRREHLQRGASLIRLTEVWKDTWLDVLWWSTMFRLPVFLVLQYVHNISSNAFQIFPLECTLCFPASDFNNTRAGVRVLSYSNWLIIFLPTNEKPSSFSLSTNDKPPYIQW